MTRVMPKGSNTTLPANVAAVRAVLCWQVLPGTPEVDVSALLLSSQGRVRKDTDFVFFNQPRHPSGRVRHRAKSRRGDLLTDTVDIDLDQLPGWVDRVVVAGSVEGADFATVSGLHILLYDIASGPDAQPLARFDITDGAGVSALLCGELYRRGEAWKFRAIGQGYASGLVGLATDFGVTIDEDEEQAAEAAPAYPPRPTLLPEPPGFALPLQGPQFLTHA
ncbi:TerD family protein [Streptacidiphilus monticola]|uniref:TerD family protein n=1 Tax=Streptacidiphilus monticola TaxID=2161674 RepID=A0ABW1FX64_9ACTN